MWAQNPITGVLTRGERFEDRNTEGRRPYDDKNRDWSDVSTSQGTPRISRNHQNREVAMKDSPLEHSEGAGPCHHLDLGLLIFRAVREYICVILSHSVCGNWILQL